MSYLLWLAAFLRFWILFLRVIYYGRPSGATCTDLHAWFCNLLWSSLIKYCERFEGSDVLLDGEAVKVILFLIALSNQLQLKVSLATNATGEWSSEGSYWGNQGSNEISLCSVFFLSFQAWNASGNDLDSLFPEDCFIITGRDTACEFDHHIQLIFILSLIPMILCSNLVLVHWN